MKKKTHFIYIMIIAVLVLMNIALYIGKTGGNDTRADSGYTQKARDEAATVDLNTATFQELMTIDGIGPVTAQKIIIRREELGGFVRVEDILSIDGISEKKFEKYREQLYVSEENKN